MRTIFDTLKDYKTIDREINVLTYSVITLVSCVFLRISWLIYHSDIKSIWPSVAVLGALMSALLISKSASRLILHNQLYKEDEQRRKVVRLTHHAMVVLNNLTDLVKYIKHHIEDANKPTTVFIGAAKEIGEKWDLFYDRELNRLLTPEAYKLIRSMSGSIFGLTSLGRGLEATLSPQALVAPLQKHQEHEAILDSLEELNNQLDSLYTELEKIRKNVK
jgi:hypothetical protein